MLDCIRGPFYFWLALAGCVLAACSSEKEPSVAVDENVVVEASEPMMRTEKEDSVAPQPVKLASPQPDSAPATTSTSSPDFQKPDKARYRPSDQRPVHNNQRLELLGIRCYESPRLKLYTDIDPQIAVTLPPVIDQAYTALADYFGPLPPDREGTEFQVTGYIMQNRALFKEAGVILDSLPAIVNGRHQGAQFWMDAQSQPYYLRHLMLHEYTHCYSMIMGEISAPVWYLEGIAESMATHTMDSDGKIQFNVMPHNKNDFGGLGRITLIEEAVAQAPPKLIQEVMRSHPADYIFNNEAYAWSWALCQFFDKHPVYAKPFRELAHHMQGSEFPKKIQAMLGDDYAKVNDAWMLFARNLQPGYDSQNAAVTFSTGISLPPETSATATVNSQQGWQSSGVRVTQGVVYEISATGRFTLAQEPKPWESTAEGISFQYFNGQPLGRLIIMLQPDLDMKLTYPNAIMKEYPVGANTSWMAPVSGTVYFRLNDAWNALADNSGAVEVTLLQKSKPIAGDESEK
ncbi:hypothetical protein Pan161_46020 [Gimesia algae]|uniref:DUF1570 domain-containing protein n=2 Tax=Gimesia algae TaxID=2527971 RepID=A0A517VIU9_9PLAN|nr:hypothetical protein Pan161_46020 [Gimesia algae]